MKIHASCMIIYFISINVREIILKISYEIYLTISNDNLIHLDLTKTIYEIQLKTMLISEEYQNVLL